MKVKIYTMETCGFCTKLKSELDNIGITYEDVDVHENESEYDGVMEIVKNDYVPVVKIGTQLLAPERDFDTIDDCIEILIDILTNE